MPQRPNFASPEEAALAGWPGSAAAHVLRVETLSDDQVDVIVDTKPSHPMRVHCCREAGGRWYTAGDIVE